ncbi:MAG: hypothetical protein J3Q66DRAFT_363624 [Benniella sp.]|nr:MAG: hypothetical protein J3Q66DRAFT_363624 [Benniella sp.]
MDGVLCFCVYVLNALSLVALARGAEGQDYTAGLLSVGLPKKRRVFWPKPKSWEKRMQEEVGRDPNTQQEAMLILSACVIGRSSTLPPWSKSQRLVDNARLLVLTVGSRAQIYD